MRMREGKYARTSSRVNDYEVQFLYRRRSVSYYGVLRFFFSEENHRFADSPAARNSTRRNSVSAIVPW